MRTKKEADRDLGSLSRKMFTLSSNVNLAQLKRGATSRRKDLTERAKWLDNRRYTTVPYGLTCVKSPTVH